MRISSNLTLFYKFFLPVFSIVFLTGITIAVWALNLGYTLGVPPLIFRLLWMAFYLGSLGFFYWATLRLKRIDMDADYAYVTNYFKTVRYPHQDIEKIVRKKVLIFPTATLYLKGTGVFGTRIAFVPARQLLDQFIATHPNIEFEVIDTK